ncbi:hypothetical protein, partial [Escherichia coli]|uniref:hypothetical protein n=1 Tax=Escherichia coli TaxID=562 RepID=UPI00200C33D4
MGSLVVGIILSAISGLLVLAGVAAIILVGVVLCGFDVDWPPITNSDGEDLWLILCTNGLSFGLFMSAVEFSFSVVLAVGAKKKKDGHLR